MAKNIALIGILLTWIIPTGCGSEKNFLLTHPSMKTIQKVSITLTPEKSECDVRDIPSGSVKFYASIKNHGDSPVTIAHPTICLPVDYQMGKSYHFKDHHGKSEILLRVIKPDGNTLILRDGPFYFDPKKIDRFTIQSHQSEQFTMGWFFQNARGRWENDRVAADLFLDKGEYKVKLLYRNFLSRAAVYDRKTGKSSFIKVWTGEIISNEVSVEMR